MIFHIVYTSCRPGLTYVIDCHISSSKWTCTHPHKLYICLNSDMQGILTLVNLVQIALRHAYLLHDHASWKLHILVSSSLFCLSFLAPVSVTTWYRMQYVGGVCVLSLRGCYMLPQAHTHCLHQAHPCVSCSSCCICLSLTPFRFL